LSHFETTRWSLVYAARLDDQAAASDALARLCTIYHPAVLAYVRRYCANVSDAEDITQSFFERLLAKRLDLVADANRGRFRQFLRAAIANFVRNHFAALGAQRRTAPEDADSLMLQADARSPEAAFELTWALTVLERALDLLAQEAAAAGKTGLFAQVREFLVDPAANLDFVALGARLQLRPNTVAVSVHRLKTRMRELVRAEVADTLSNPADLSHELRQLRSVKASR
jgi:RNA polymerase sigma factor (sigma-70 family)